jgi:hypothetical protein
MKTKNAITICIVFFIIIICLTECKKDKDSFSINATEITLKRNQTFNLVVSPDASGCVFESENDYIATVSSSGVITAQLVGETYIVVKIDEKDFTDKCKVTVTPEYQMYREPYLIFGKPKANVKSYETRYLLLEDDITLFYLGENSYIDYLLYTFEKSAYSISCCLIPISYVKLLTDYLEERYVPVYTTDSLSIMMTADSKTTVGMSQSTIIGTEYFMIIYFPDPDSKNSVSLILNTEWVKTKDIINKITTLKKKI